MDVGFCERIQNKVPMSFILGFKFFKRNGTPNLVADSVAQMREIAKKLPSAPKQYADGDLLQDVYVAETRRVYNVAKRLRP